MERALQTLGENLTSQWEKDVCIRQRAHVEDWDDVDEVVASVDYDTAVLRRHGGFQFKMLIYEWASQNR